MSAAKAEMKAYVSTDAFNECLKLGISAQCRVSYP